MRFMLFETYFKRVPITKIHQKKLHVMLDIDPKIGHLRVLTSVDLCFESSSLFPNARSCNESRRIQRSTIDLYCTASVPFGSAQQTVGEGREKERLTLQRIASPIALHFCSLFVCTTYVPNFCFPRQPLVFGNSIFREPKNSQKLPLGGEHFL